MPSPSPDSPAAVFQSFVDGGEIAGAVTLVADRDGVLDVSAVGFADIAAGKLMREDTLFWVASQTKPITGTALMMLVDEGKVNVDDPVEKYLPEFRGQKVTGVEHGGHVLLWPPARPISVRDVLTHTSGLPFGSMVEYPTRDLLPLRTTVRSYAMLPLLSEPGTRYEYSNAGINIAGRIIEVVSGMLYEEFLQTRLFDSLGMSDTTFWPDDGQVARLAKAYRATAGGELEETKIDQLHYPLTDRARRFSLPGGGLFSTAADCAKFCRMILHGGTLDGRQYLSEEAWRQMTSRQTAEGMAESYGFGWSVNVGKRQCNHGGALMTQMTVDLERGAVRVFLVQTYAADAGKGVSPAREAFNRAREEFGGGERGIDIMGPQA